MVTLEEIYQKYFDCSVPFRKSGRLTKSGAIAHEKLINLLKDLESIGVVSDARIATVELDEISNEGISYRQEMCNDLMRFITSESEEYELEESVIVESPDGETFKVKFLTRDTDYNDIFMTEEKWKLDEDNNIDIYNFTCLGDEDAKKVFEAVLIQEINNGWDWESNALDALNEKFPDASSDEICDFLQYWQNLATDAQNLEDFADKYL